MTLIFIVLFKEAQKTQGNRIYDSKLYSSKVYNKIKEIHVLNCENDIKKKKKLTNSAFKHHFNFSFYVFLIVKDFLYLTL